MKGQRTLKTSTSTPHYNTTIIVYSCSVLKDKDTLYAYLPEKRSPFRSTAFAGQKSDSGCGGDQISLGVIFDRKLSFIPHLKYVKKKALKALNILKVIGNTEWGADRKVMLRLYRSLIRSTLDYGCIVYGSARKSYLQMLDPIHNQGLRLCL